MPQEVWFHFYMQLLLKECFTIKYEVAAKENFVFVNMLFYFIIHCQEIISKTKVFSIISPFSFDSLKFCAKLKFISSLYGIY